MIHFLDKVMQRIGFRVITKSRFNHMKTAEARLRVACRMMDRSFTVTGFLDREYKPVSNQQHYKDMHAFVETCMREGHAKPHFRSC